MSSSIPSEQYELLTTEDRAVRLLTMFQKIVYNATYRGEAFQYIGDDRFGSSKTKLAITVPDFVDISYCLPHLCYFSDAENEQELSKM